MACQEYRVGVKIPWPGYLTPTQFYVKEILKNPNEDLTRDQIFSYVIVP